MHSRKLFTAATSLLAAGGVLEGGIAQAAAPKKASLRLTVPKQVKSGTKYSIKTSGFSGKFDRVAIFLSLTSCAKTQAAEAKHDTGFFWPVKAQVKFSESMKFTAGTPGGRHACTYLFVTKNGASSGQLHRSKSFMIV